MYSFIKGVHCHATMPTSSTPMFDVLMDHVDPSDRHFVRSALGSLLCNVVSNRHCVLCGECSKAPLIIFKIIVACATNEPCIFVKSSKSSSWTKNLQINMFSDEGVEYVRFESHGMKKEPYFLLKQHPTLAFDCNESLVLRLHKIARPTTRYMRLLKTASGSLIGYHAWISPIFVYHKDATVMDDRLFRIVNVKPLALHQKQDVFVNQLKMELKSIQMKCLLSFTQDCM